MFDRAHEDLAAGVGPEREPAVIDLNQAGTSPLEDANAAPGVDTQLRHAADPAGLSVDLGHVGPIAGSQQLQR